MKRFYKAVTVAAAPDGFAVHLDNRPVMTPARRLVIAPTEKLAAAVAAEWKAVDGEIYPDRMPLTQLLMTARDRVADERPAMQTAVLAHLDTDLLCYRAAPPADIAARQRLLWDPWLDWFARRYGVSLLTTDGLNALRQPKEAKEATIRRVTDLDIFRFAAVQLVVGITGSLVLGLAMLEGAATPAEIEAAIYAEEDWKAEFYREDIHGTAPQEEKRRVRVKADLAAARDYLGLLGA